ncbi:LysR family transcriptional regulator YeiE [Minicystis rosea]|nr:LysR family transcriptional regulator YeiE [Minicystis rosea]
MPSALDPRLLATLRAVASAGTISAAAKVLHLSQPAVTAQVRKLEEQCGAPLLVRSARGVAPTEAGLRLIGYADRVEALLDEAAEVLAAPPAEARVLTLAASTTIASYVIPPLLAAFAKSAGPLTVRMDVGNTEEVLERVRNGAAPLGLVEGHARASRVRLERFLADELCAVVASDAGPELTQLRRAADLRHVPIIWREPGSGTRAVVERALKNAVGNRPPHDRDVQIGSTEAIKGAALAGLGVAFLSRWSIGAELTLGRLRILPLRDLAIPRAFSWALPPGGATGMAKRFQRFAARTAGSAPGESSRPHASKARSTEQA